MKDQIVLVGDYQEYSVDYIQILQSLEGYEFLHYTPSELKCIESQRVLGFFVDTRENIKLILEKTCIN